MNKKSLGLALVTMMVLSLLATGASAADWPTFQQNNYNNGVISENVDSTPEPVWNETPTSSGWLGWESAPIIANDTVYNVFCNGSVFAYELADGDLVWQNSNVGGGGSFELAVPAYDNDSLFVALSAGNSSTSTGVHALNAINGNVIWSNTSSTYFPSNHQFNTGVKYDYGEDAIYLGSVHMADSSNSDEGNFYCVDADTGVVKWTYENGDCGYYWATPAIIGDYVVVGDDDGVIRSFDKSTGTEVENVTTSDGSIRSAIVYDGSGYIYFTTTGGSVFKYSFNSATGDIGDTATESDDGNGRMTTSPAVTDSHVFVGTDGGDLICFDTSLTEEDRVAVDAQVKASPVVTTGGTYNQVYVTTNGGKASCTLFDKTSGEHPTRNYYNEFGPSEYTLQGVAIVDGYIVYGNDAKRLMCFN